MLMLVRQPSIKDYNRDAGQSTNSLDWFPRLCTPAAAPFTPRISLFAQQQDQYQVGLKKVSVNEELIASREGVSVQVLFKPTRVLDKRCKC